MNAVIKELNYLLRDYKKLLWQSNDEFALLCESIGGETRSFIMRFLETIDNAIVTDDYFNANYEKKNEFWSNMVQRFASYICEADCSLYIAIQDFLKAIQTEKDNDYLKGETEHKLTEYQLVFRRCQWMWDSKIED